MVIDSYPVEDVFSCVPEVVPQTDPVLKTLDTLLEDDQLYQRVRTDLGTPIGCPRTMEDTQLWSKSFCTYYCLSTCIAGDMKRPPSGWPIT
jgi:hypothetical protein